MLKQAIPQGVEIDLCEHHGVWLDRGELESLLQGQALPSGRGARKRSGGAAAIATVGDAGAASPGSAPGGFGAAVERAGQQFGRSVVHGAGSTLGRRLMNGVVDAVFGRR